MAYDKISLSEIARLYYEHGMTQSEIAKRLGISRPIISRKLAEARESGVVRIFINSDDSDMTELERRLFAAFNIKALRVAKVPTDDGDLAVDLTARLGAEVFSRFISPGDRVGVAWGWTLKQLTGHFPQCDGEVDTVVQCTGNIDDVKSNSSPDGMIKEMAQKLRAKRARTLPVPAMVGSPIIANTLKYDKHLQQAFSSIGECNKFLVNIALPDTSTCLYQQGYLDDSDLFTLKESGAVGSICCRFFNERGEMCAPEIDSRTLGVTIDQLRDAECVMGCLAGADKAQAIYCALKSGLLDVVVIDSVTAEKILSLLETERMSPTGAESVVTDGDKLT